MTKNGMGETCGREPCLPETGRREPCSREAFAGQTHGPTTCRTRTLAGTALLVAATLLAVILPRPAGAIPILPREGPAGRPVGSAAAPAPQQAPPPGRRLSGARILEVRTDPEAPAFGEVFQVHATVRLPRRSDLSLVDTLGSSNDFRSAGAGHWEESPAPGDSVDVRATFPVLPFRDGNRPLPGLLVIHEGAGNAPGVENPPERLALGEVEVTPLAGFGGEDPGGSPRPPADVVGGSWSAWILLAGGVVLVGLLGLGRAVVRERSSRGEDAPAGLPVEGSGTLDRGAALRRLEDIRDTGWHRNGRIDDFYRATTDTLRRFVEGTDPSWSESLTSTELMDRAATRWGQERLEELPLTVQRAEWVKFGDARPDAEEAESDWTVVRDWIREAP